MAEEENSAISEDETNCLLDLGQLSLFLSLFLSFLITLVCLAYTCGSACMTKTTFIRIDPMNVVYYAFIHRCSVLSTARSGSAFLFVWLVCLFVCLFVNMFVCLLACLFNGKRHASRRPVPQPQKSSQSNNNNKKSHRVKATLTADCRLLSNGSDFIERKWPCQTGFDQREGPT